MIVREHVITGPGRVAPFARAVGALFSFEAAFVLFLMAGTFKGDPRFAWVPVDLTALFFGLSVVAAAWILMTRGLRPTRLGAAAVATMAALALYGVASLAWSPSLAYGGEKAFFLATLVAWSLAGPALVVAGDRRRVRRLVGFVAVLAAWVAVEAALAFARAPDDVTLDALGATYLGLGRLVGLGALVVLVLALRPRLAWPARLLAFAGYAALVTVLLLAGGRGPLLATLAASLLPLLTLVRPARPGGLAIARSAPWLVALVLAGGGALAYLATRPDPPPTVARLQNALSVAAGGSSVATRAAWYRASAELFAERPVAGHGIGAWPVRMGFADARAYPHNLFAEVAVELGLGGLLLVAALVVLALAGLAPVPGGGRDLLRLLLAMLLVQALLNAMVTGDVPDNRVAFAALGLATCLRRERT